jgi:hypothetical protein
LLKIEVLIPIAVGDFDEAHAGFHQSPGEQTFAPMSSVALSPMPYSFFVASVSLLRSMTAAFLSAS